MHVSNSKDNPQLLVIRPPPPSAGLHDLQSFNLIYDTHSVASGVLAFTAVISPPVHFAVERGNIDILIFFVSVVTFYFLARRGSLGAIFATATVLAHKRWGTPELLSPACSQQSGFFSCSAQQNSRLFP